MNIRIRRIHYVLLAVLIALSGTGSILIEVNSFGLEKNEIVNRRRISIDCNKRYLTYPASTILPRSWEGRTKRHNERMSQHETKLYSFPPTQTLSLTVKPIVYTVSLMLLHIIGGLTGTPFVAKATQKGSWYRKILLPQWTPPDKLFPFAWTFLYGCMGASISRILLLLNVRQYTVSTTIATTNSHWLLALWIFHYGLNLLWAPVFFGKQNFRLGLGINYMLIVTLAFGIIRPFYQIDKIAGILLLPYLLWLMFATVLNETICQLNPTVKGYNNAKFYIDLQKLQTLAHQYAFGE